jgi:hypothetical protein
MRNAFLPIGSIPQTEDYASISKSDRERMKKVYPKPSLAKSPAIAKDLDVL